MTALAAGAAPVRLGRDEGRSIIKKHSKSFSLASRLLEPEARDDAVALYAYCRRADDAVDLVSAERADSSVATLASELDDVYAGRPCSEPVVAEFQRLVFERAIPRDYPSALIQGLRDDAAGVRYESLFDLHRYCWYVAGSVGAMMCHVLGVRRPRAVVNGAHLGMAMQLTNICRDVAEDWERGRVYVPAELLTEPALEPRTGALPQRLVPQFRSAVRRLLADASSFYASGDEGLCYLPFRSRIAVATARNVYAAIGEVLLERGADVNGGRAYVPAPAKLWHVTRACVTSTKLALTTPPFSPARLAHPIRFPEDVLPC